MTEGIKTSPPQNEAERALTDAQGGELKVTTDLNDRLTKAAKEAAASQSEKINGPLDDEKNVITSPQNPKA